MSAELLTVDGNSTEMKIEDTGRIRKNKYIKVEQKVEKGESSGWKCSQVVESLFIYFGKNVSELRVVTSTYI